MCSIRHRILVVENDKPIRTMLALLLELEDFDVRSATDGADALRSDPAWQPDVVVLDLMMPVMDGREFLARRRAVPHLADVPVIVASASPNAERLADEPGVAAVLVKPHDVDALLSAIDAAVATAGHGTTPRR